MSNFCFILTQERFDPQVHCVCMIRGEVVYSLNVSSVNEVTFRVDVHMYDCVERLLKEIEFRRKMG